MELCTREEETTAKPILVCDIGARLSEMFTVIEFNITK